MEKAYKYRLYPTKEQEQQLKKSFGCCRYIYNHFLALRKEKWDTGQEGLSYNQMSSLLTEYKKEKVWLKEVDKFALQNSIRDLDRAHQNFFKQNAGYPHFKSKRNYWQSYRTNWTNDNIKVSGDRIKLPKLGCIKYVNSRDIGGRILNVTVSVSPAGRYYASVCCDVGVIPNLGEASASIGIDLGLKEFAVLSSGEHIEHPKHLLKAERKLKRLQRNLSRKQKGSEDRNKARTKVAKLHEKVSDMRKDFLHKLSTRIICENQTIVMEKLNVKGMVRNHKLAKRINDSGWGMFGSFIKYKSEWYGKAFQQISTFYPSSQACSCCGEINPLVKDLSIREWVCGNCGSTHNRDENASTNILKEGLRLLHTA